MKKVLLLLVAIASVLQASAQEMDSMQGQSASISIDSLSLRLNILQHDYDFMYCDYELHKLIMDLKDLAHSIDNSSKGVVINVYNSRYDHNLYNAILKDYNSDCALFDALKEKIDAVKAAVFVKMMSSSFTDKEIQVLTLSFEVVSKVVMKIESSLNYYNAAIKAYRDKI